MIHSSLPFPVDADPDGKSQDWLDDELRAAVRSHDPKRAAELLGYGADPGTRDGFRGHTAAMHSVVAPDCCRLICRVRPESALVADPEGRTPLLFAARGGYVEAFAILAPHSDIMAQTSEGLSAMELALHDGVWNPICDAIWSMMSDRGEDLLAFQQCCSALGRASAVPADARPAHAPKIDALRARVDALREQLELERSALPARAPSSRPPTL